jgi:hypothetical protein
MIKNEFREPQYIIVFCIFIGLLFYGKTNAQTPLDSYIKTHEYTPFVIPRTDWGVGTSVTMHKGKETIVALNKSCLQLTGDSADAFLENNTYTISTNNKLELGLEKLFDEKLNIQAAFNDKRIKKVVISITGAQETIIPTIDIRKKIDTLGKANDEACLDAIVGKKNIVIVRTLSIASLSYKFLDTNNIEINFDANFMKTINLSDSLQRMYQGQKELIINKRAFVGYRASKFKAKPGLTNTEVTEQLLKPAEIEALKRQSSKK